MVCSSLTREQPVSAWPGMYNACSSAPTTHADVGQLTIQIVDREYLLNYAPIMLAAQYNLGVAEMVLRVETGSRAVRLCKRVDPKEHSADCSHCLLRIRGRCVVRLCDLRLPARESYRAHGGAALRHSSRS